VRDYPKKEVFPDPRNDDEKFIQDQWNPATYEGAPVSLQIIGRRHTEEKLLAVLDVVEAARNKFPSAECNAVS
jgi:amidase